MSKRQNQTFQTGADWSFQVELRKLDGTPLTPSEVRFYLGTEDGAVISWTSATNASNVFFELDATASPPVYVASIVIPKNARANIINDVYDYAVMCLDTDGALDGQMHGTVTVERSGFTEAA